jgi:ABC-type transport system involved in cytochrome c biogenesis permease subunit
MVEHSLTCAIVNGVAAYRIRGGAGSRGRARARQRRLPALQSQWLMMHVSMMLLI